MRREISSGGIVFRNSSQQSEEAQSAHRTQRARKNKIYVLMIKDHNDKYTFPKGLIDKGENPKKTAIREVEEETGVKAEIVEKLGDIKYLFQWQGEKVFKIVSYYLMKTNQEKVKPQTEEIKGVEWISIKKVLEKNGYKNQLPIVEKAIKRIKKITSKKSLKDF